MLISSDARQSLNFEGGIFRAAPRGSDGDINPLEFSDYGRSPRFVSGWWIVPGLLLGNVLLVFFLAV